MKFWHFYNERMAMNMLLLTLEFWSLLEPVLVHWSKRHCDTDMSHSSTNHWRIPGGSSQGYVPPPGSNFFSFSCSFWEKIGKNNRLVPSPLWLVSPPLGILDPPLQIELDYNWIKCRTVAMNERLAYILILIWPVESLENMENNHGSMNDICSIVSSLWLLSMVS